MIGNEHREMYSDRVMGVIHDFIQMWIRFEQLIHDELARTQEPLVYRNSNHSENLYGNFGMFYRVSSTMYPDKSLSMGELSSALSMPLSTATRVANWMVDNELIQRSPDPEDRRVVRVSLTDNGKHIHGIIENYAGLRLKEILSCLTADEQTMLFALIGRVAAALKKVT